MPLHAAISPLLRHAALFTLSDFALRRKHMPPPAATHAMLPLFMLLILMTYAAMALLLDTADDASCPYAILPLMPRLA